MIWIVLVLILASTVWISYSIRHYVEQSKWQTLNMIESKFSEAGSSDLNRQVYNKIVTLESQLAEIKRGLASLDRQIDSLEKRSR